MPEVSAERPNAGLAASLLRRHCCSRLCYRSPPERAHCLALGDAGAFTVAGSSSEMPALLSAGSMTMRELSAPKYLPTRLLCQARSRDFDAKAALHPATEIFPNGRSEN
jgi:hypothetical protein